MDASGILVFILQIGSDDVRGFSAWDDRAPLIVANSSRVSPAARIFTLVHELGHLYTRQDAACVEVDTVNRSRIDKLERWCEDFGAAVLMPLDTYREFLDKRRINRNPSMDDVRAAAQRFRVSHRAAALRMIDLGYAPFGFYSQVINTFEVSTSAATDTNTRISSPPRYVARTREYGIDAIRTVLDALPPRDALDILRLRVEDVRRIAQENPDVRVP
jgi:Zn-dependent peptidase ImmA (M78 family)